MAALVDVRQREFFEWVMHQLQVPLGEVEIFSGCLQIAVAEQNLNGAQISSSFKQMGGPAVAQGV
jgi:hypothetical protein